MAGIVLFVKLRKKLVLAYAYICNRVVIKLTIICFENNIKSLLNAAKWIPVNGLDNMVPRHTIFHRKF